ncbi:MAG: ComF family protein [Candidatus Omnitrophota bacterium]|nr:hypothetical protein [Candidatus Omnitrophota bacterium]
MRTTLFSAHRTLDLVLNVLFSPCCPICDERPAYSSGICSDCLSRIPLSSSPIKTYDNDPDIIWSCTPYEGIIRKCLHELKYRGNDQMNRIFFEILNDLPVKKIFSENHIDLIIPVPLHRERYKYRGFNQTLIFSGFLSDLSGIRVDTDLLLRVRHSRPQTGLSRQERIDNITKNVFSVSYPERVKNKTIVLVDDVLTTGTTMKRCAKVLLGSGANSVYGFTIAKTM